MKYIKSICISLVIFLLFGLSYYFITCDRLTDNEYKEVSKLYSRMSRVDDSIKNEFYRDFALKYLDREFVLEELRKDTLEYSLIINERLIDKLIAGSVRSEILKYISNCDLDFENFKGLNVSTELFDLYRTFGNTYLPKEEYFEIFANEVLEIVKDEQEYILSVQKNRGLKIFVYSLLYLLLCVFVYLVEIKKITLSCVSKVEPYVQKCKNNIKSVYLKVKSKWNSKK